MIITTKSNESAKTAKAGEVLPGRGNASGGPVNGEQGAQAHATEGALAKVLTAEGITSQLKSDLSEAVEELPTTRTQTESEEETQQTEEGDGKAKVQSAESKAEEAGAGKPQKNANKPEQAEALREAEAWKEMIAELEEKLENAEGDESEALEKQIHDAKKEMAEWEVLAKEGKGTATEGDDVEVVPTALQEAINEYEAKGGELPPALQKLVEKRIHKLTSEREQQKQLADQAEAKASQLEQENDRLKANGAAVERSPTTLPDLKELAAMEANGTRMVEELEAVIDGTATEEEATRVAKLLGSERLDTPEGQRAAKRQLRAVEKFLQTIPAERQRVQAFRSEEAKAAPIAKEWFPFLFDKADPDYQEAQAVLQVMPDLRTATPNHQIALGTYVLGLRELRKLHPEAFGGKNGANGSVRTPGATKLPRKAPRKSPASGGGSAAPQKATTRAREAEEASARAQHEKHPTKASVEKLLKISLRG